MQITSFSRPFKKALATNSTAASFASKIPVIAEPTNDGVVDLVQGLRFGADVPQRAVLVPYGLSANNDAFDMKVIGWRHIGADLGQSVPLWVPMVLGTFACTMGNVTGVATAPVLNTEFFCDTITAKSGPLIPKRPAYDATPAATFISDITIYSPADDSVGYIVLWLYGFEKMELSFDQITNTPSMNCLFALL